MVTKQGYECTFMNYYIVWFFMINFRNELLYYKRLATMFFFHISFKQISYICNFSFQVSISRGSSGFGFTVIDSCPVKVGKVEKGSPAAETGLCPGDHILSVNGHNVSRSQSSGVAKIVKYVLFCFCMHFKGKLRKQIIILYFFPGV